MQLAPIAMNHPHVTAQAGLDAHGRRWILCQCARCGENWRRPCHFPQRTNEWVWRFCTQHGHGLVPQPR